MASWCRVLPKTRERQRWRRRAKRGVKRRRRSDGAAAQAVGSARRDSDVMRKGKERRLTRGM
eukprot:1359582-Pleurochrysis_carterae.AAC.1